MAKLLDHVCILVEDINQAIDHFRGILGAVAPGVLDQELAVTEHHSGEDRFLSTVFVASGDGCSIQLLQPVNPESPLYRRLERRGEHIHHLGFTSPNLEETVQSLQDEGITLHPGGGHLITDATNPHIRWTWISPTYAHGALIEVMDTSNS
jgi:catechol 2,3-dioxygenase-like lactoylglutathione lyase family enzyme